MIPYLKMALQMIVSLGLLFAASRWINLADFLRIVKSAHPGFLALALGIHFFLLLLNAFKIKLLVGKDSPPLYRLFSLNLMKLFFNNSLPGGMAGEVARIYYLGKKIGSWERSSAVIFFDRVTSQSALGLSILIAIVIRARPSSHWTANAALILVGTAVLGVLLHSGILIAARMKFGHFESFLDRFRFKVSGTEFRGFFLKLIGNWRLLSGISLICILSQAFWIARLSCLLWSLQVAAPLAILPLALGLGSLLSLLPISLGGLGLNESAFAFVFGMAGSTQEIGLSVATLQRLTCMVPALLGGLIYIKGAHRLAAMLARAQQKYLPSEIMAEREQMGMSGEA